MNNKILISICAYNEEENIENVLRELINLKRKLNFEILVVNDGSKDKTEDIARKYADYIITHPRNLGPGAAEKTSYKFMLSHGYSYIVFVDADGQHPPEEVTKILRPLVSNKADFVIGSRFLGRKNKVPIIRNVGIKFFSKLVSLLINHRITDITSGFIGVNRKVANLLIRTMPSGIVAIDRVMAVGLNNFKIKEVPVRMKQRTKGKSYLNPKRMFFYPIYGMYSIIKSLILYKGK